MKTRDIGSLSVSAFGLGCNNLGARLNDDTSVAIVRAAVDAGITFFDTADRYGQGRSESVLGEALASDRESVVVATKFGMEMDAVGGRGARPEYVRFAAEASLRRLGTDYIDLYQIHQPDPDVPIAETAGALRELVEAGKVLEVGCSNFDSSAISEAHEAFGAMTLASAQNQYSLLHRGVENEIIPLCIQLGVAFIPYFPLASGILTGKYRPGQAAPAGSRLSRPSRFRDRFFSQETLTVAAELEAFAEERGHTLLELAFSWLLQRPAVASVIAGASSPEQVVSNAGAGGWHLSEAELAEVDRITGRSHVRVTSQRD